MQDNTIDKRAMDKVLAYRNLLAAEDHLDELATLGFSEGFTQEMLNTKSIIESIRDSIMPEEKDPHMHCLVKHLSIAYEAIREATKGMNDAESRWLRETTYSLLIEALERLWDRKINTCERCMERNSNELRGLQEDAGGSTTETSFSGDTRSTIQGSSDYRIPSVSSS